MDTQQGIIAWFARNSVAANLLMWIILIGGYLTLFTINKEVFPQRNMNKIVVNIPYPGAAPQEIEEGVNIKVEEAIKNIEGIKKITSIASESLGTINIEVENKYEPQYILDEIKLQIDGIATFPDNIEQASIFQIQSEPEIIWIAIYGNNDLITRKELAKQLRDEITQLPAVTRADLSGTPNYEIAIEVSENKLREFGLTFKQLAQAVKNTSIDLPGGAIKAYDGDILLRTKGQAYSGDEFANIVLLTRHDGSRLLLSDVATIKDGFEEGLRYTNFNTQPAVFIKVISVGKQNAMEIARQVNQFIAEKKHLLPADIAIDTWRDKTYYLQGRLDLMLGNIKYGALLVFIILALFMQIRLAFWVMVGLPICFLGTLLLMPMEVFGLSINIITLFGFILVLGIVVDDAIIIGESAYTEIEQQGHSLDNVIIGAKRVAMPATFGVLTSIAAFAPMLLVPGSRAIFWQSIGYVVIFCLIFSLIESKLILPAHLAHMKFKKPQQETAPWSKIQHQLDTALKNFIQHKYQPFIQFSLQQRYNVAAIFISVLIITIAFVQGGFIRWVSFPNLPSDFINVNITMNEGTADTITLQALQTIEEALYETNAELKQKYHLSVVRHSSVELNSSNTGKIFVELAKGEDREIDGLEIANVWRSKITAIPGLKSLNIKATAGHDGGGDIAFRLSSNNLQQLSQAARQLKQKLATFQGVYDISDTLSSNSKEIRLSIKPSAQALGLSLTDLAHQVRHGFYGFEAQRLLRDNEEIKVLVRYPLKERQTIGYLENMRIRTANGIEVPFAAVAHITMADSYANITRVDGIRAVTVSARVNKTLATPREISNQINDEYFPTLSKQFATIKAKLDGSSRDEMDTGISLIKGAFIALFIIYALMAIPLRSYGQPLIIMSIIPFGMIGAIFGHWLLGLDFSFLSIFGLIALSGVVVNDSLIMVDFINKARKAGDNIQTAAINAGCQRFRAIILTSLTTFFGLVPILLEKSLQAQIVIPMAVALAFGILFATLITLLLIPSLYVILEDTKNLIK